MSKYLPLFLFLFCLPLLNGCADKPEKPVSAYGKIRGTLPKLDEAEKPFDFPFAGETDHSKCVFNEDDLF
ncbi:MAG: hypothetical protein FWE67_12390 [Planctomycetaceae bacterium]|nr:hypothetical protein [Planctomycetaceae bacterium]